MYPAFLLPAAPALDDDVAARALAFAKDADNDEASRVGAVHALRGARDTFATSKALVPLLNEPRMWLGSEVQACSNASIALGVDDHGQLVASPSPATALMKDDNGDLHCADLATRVVPIAYALRLVSSLAERPPWACMPPNGAAIFVVHEPRRQPEVVIIDSEATIGSNTACDVVVARPEVQPRHARVVVRDGKAIVVDLKSGTTVNETKLTSPRVLKTGDVVGVGDARIVLEDVIDDGLLLNVPIEQRPGTIVRLASGHAVYLDAYRAGVVRYAPPTAVVIDRGEAALGVRYHDDGTLDVEGAPLADD